MDRLKKRIIFIIASAALLIAAVAYVLIRPPKPFDLIRVIRNPQPHEYYNFGDRMFAWKGKIFVRAEKRTNPSGPAILAFDYESGDLLYSIPPPNVRPGHLFGVSIAATDDFLVVRAGGFAWSEAYLFDVNTGRIIRKLKDPNKPPNTYHWGEIAANEEIIAVAYPANLEVLLYDAKTGDYSKTIYPPEGRWPDPGFGLKIAIEGNQLLILDNPYMAPGSEIIIHVYDLAANEFRLHIPTPPSSQYWLHDLHACNGTIFFSAFEPLEPLSGIMFIRKAKTVLSNIHAFDIADGKWRFTTSDPNINPNSLFGGPFLCVGDELIVSEINRKSGNGELYCISGSTGKIVRSIECPLPSRYNGPLNTFDRRNWTGGHKFGSSLARMGEDLLVGAPGYNDREGAVFVLRGPESSGK